AVIALLTDRLVEEDDAADEIGEARCREEHVAVRAAVLFRIGQIDGLEALLDGSEALVRGQDALALRRELACYGFEIVGCHGCTLRWNLHWNGDKVLGLRRSRTPVAGPHDRRRPGP